MRGGVCEGRRLQDSPSSVKSWAQRALCTPASGARSRELEACPHGSSVSVVPWGEAETLAVEAKGFTKLVLSTTQGLNLPNLKSSC